MDNRPNWHTYFLDIAKTISTRSNCSRRKLGAVIVKNNQILSCGYNGTPSGMKNCFDGGCPRCASATGTMEGYDRCLCIHAEENSILFAAKNGISIDNCIMYCTTRPCINCFKSIIQSGIVKVVYEIEHIYPDKDIEITFKELVNNCKVELIRI